MKNSLSDHNLFIDSEEDDDPNEEEEEEEGSKACPSEVAGDDADGSDSPSDDDCRPRSRPSSHSTNWPQSYRKFSEILESGDRLESNAKKVIVALESAGEDDGLRLCISLGDDRESETELMGLIWNVWGTPST
ncbi:hypothetical protein GW17_00005378 [Ensete ventricosum]|nr:hypothetical protein GW17_00005378 [Ensete ventricosum]RZS02320.1 hypothetical protein BHM03_00032350 [Ensete ventricosum]